MTVEIWSDIVCPFCYIGKRKFEAALSAFTGRDTVAIRWRSFQLDPSADRAPGTPMAEALAAKKGWNAAQTKAALEQVTAMAQEVGLHFNMADSLDANTFDAHRLLHLAASHGRQNELGERLFRAYFTEGRDLASSAVLQELAEQAGLPSAEVRALLGSDQFAEAVQADEVAANKFGARGVPFFVFNNKYAVSGAQPPKVFSEVLEKVWAEEKPVTDVAGGICTTDGICN